jgi:hypothetical protein
MVKPTYVLVTASTDRWQDEDAERSMYFPAGPVDGDVAMG